MCSVSDLNERVRKLAESVAGLGYWSMDLETRTIIWSPECFVLFGRDPDSWIPTKENFLADMVPSEQQTFGDRLENSISRNEPYNYEYQYYRGGDRNDVRWIRTDRDFLTSDDGSIFMVGVAQDITNQKHAELALKESNMRFQAFADAASDWFWEMDENLRFSYMSERAEGIVGVPISYFMGKTRREVAGEVIENEKWQSHLQDLESHRPFRDFRFVRKGHDGRLHYVSTSGISLFDDAGKFKGYAGASSNLTDRMEAEETAHLAREQLANAVNGLSELFALWDPQDRLVVCNDRFRTLNQQVIETTEPGTLFKDHIRAVVDKGLFALINGQEEEWYKQRLENHKNPGQPFEIARQDRRWLLVKEQKLDDGSTITISTDITDRKKNEEALRSAKQKAEFANRAKSEFLAHMSHELRTPLNAIIGFSQICESEILGKQENRKYVEYASDIRSASTHLLELISDVLDLSKLEEGELQIYESVFPLEKALEQCLTMIHGRATLKGVGLQVSVEPKTLSIKADERLIKQIVLNLLSNAVKFTPEGNQILIKATLDNSHRLVLSVIDPGCGIDAADINKILEPYTQLRANPDIAHEGTGLGLPIVKGLTELHGGQLRIESEVGKGTTVSVQLPAERIM